MRFGAGRCPDKRERTGRGWPCFNFPSADERRSAVTGRQVFPGQRGLLINNRNASRLCLIGGGGVRQWIPGQERFPARLACSDRPRRCLRRGLGFQDRRNCSRRNPGGLRRLWRNGGGSLAAWRNGGRICRNRSLLPPLFATGWASPRSAQCHSRRRQRPAANGAHRATEGGFLQRFRSRRFCNSILACSIGFWTVLPRPRSPRLSPALAHRPRKVSARNLS